MKAGDKEDVSEEIEAHFEFFDPSEKDFHAVSELLRQQFKDIIPLDIAGLTDTIIKQVGMSFELNW